VPSYYPFFGGAATVAGALIGLLFVALSLSPDRLRDARSIEHQAIAATAFTALVDALFVSLIGLQPGGGLQDGAVIFGALGLSSTVGLTLRLWRNRHLAHLSNRWPFFLVVIMAVYAAQLVTGLLYETPAGAADRAATFVYVMFGVGIARAWQLLGLKGGGILDELGVTITPSIHIGSAHSPRNPEPPSGDPAPASGDPAPASGDPAPASGDPAPASGDPAPASGDPAPPPGDPAPPPGDPPSAA
jgi:hypothetical protein